MSVGTRSSRAAKVQLAGWCLLSSLSGSLTGCELSRPEGAYNPVYPDAGLDDFGPGDGDDQDGSVHDVPDTFKDASVPDMPKNEKHAGLLGFYLARFDEPQQSRSEVGVSTIVIDSVTSRYFLIFIDEDEDGNLRSTEQMCGQSVQSSCSSNCEASTSLYSSAANKIPSSPPIVRELTLREDSERGSLNALGAFTYLGYNAAKGDTALPTSIDDPRLWQGSSPGQEGLYTQLQLTVSALGIQTGLTCQVNIVQQLRLGWTAYTKQNDGSFVLDGARGTFQTNWGSTEPHTDSKILAAKADPADKQAECMGEGSSDPKTTAGVSVVVFKKTDSDRRKCPSVSDFNKLVPPELTP